MKNNLKGHNSAINKAENQINDLKHRKAKNNQSEEKRKRKKQTRIV